MDGARAVQKELERRYAGRDLRVFAVYFDVVPGDARASWKPRLHDRRVTSYWDEKILLGRKLAESPDWNEPFDFVWDAWILFDAEVRWGTAPPVPIAAGGPVDERIEELRAALQKVGIEPAGH